AILIRERSKVLETNGCGSTSASWAEMNGRDCLTDTFAFSPGENFPLLPLGLIWDVAAGGGRLSLLRGLDGWIASMRAHLLSVLRGEILTALQTVNFTSHRLTSFPYH